MVVDLPCVPAIATPSRSAITWPSISAYLIGLQFVLAGGLEFRVGVFHGGRADHQIHLARKQFAHLIAGDLCAALGQFDRLRVRLGFRAADDCAAVEEHARQPAHPGTADADKVDSFPVKRLAGQFRHYVRSHLLAYGISSRNSLNAR